MSPILTTSSLPLHPPDCPGWEYSDHPQKNNVLPERVARVMLDLRRGNLLPGEVALDTRGVHRFCFLELTPTGCEYYAGHYRGENYRCLLHYEVGVPSDPRVGCPPKQVSYRMRQLNDVIASCFVALGATPRLTPRDRLRYLVIVTARAFELFLTIHPFTNGNGHSGRFLVHSVLGKYGHWPLRFRVDPQPGPPYIAAIVAHRNGDPVPLETYILSTLTPS